MSLTPQSTTDRAGGLPPSATAPRLAGAPISWGVCEVPGWGRQLTPDRVLGEMRALGITATELGPIDWLPVDPEPLRAALKAHDIALVGGFVPLVLHEADAEPARDRARAMAATFAAAGADVFVAALVVDDAWSAPIPLDDTAWGHLVAHLAEVAAIAADAGLTLVVHPHVGTLVETAADVERLLATSDVRWCLDTGHLLIGGVNPVAFAREYGDRVAHVHLKDVDGAVAARLRSGELTLVEATQQGLFRPLGTGGAHVAEVLAELREQGYGGWLVLEQDAAIMGDEPAAGTGPVEDVVRSLDFLAHHGFLPGSAA